MGELFFGHADTVIGDRQGNGVICTFTGEGDDSLFFAGFDGIFGEIGEEHFEKDAITGNHSILACDANFTAACSGGLLIPLTGIEEKGHHRTGGRLDPVFTDKG